MSRGEEWFKNAILVTIGLFIVCTLVVSFAQANPLFASIMLGGGGVLAVIVAKAKGLFYNVDFSLGDLKDLFYR